MNPLVWFNDQRGADEGLLARCFLSDASTSKTSSPVVLGPALFVPVFFIDACAGFTMVDGSSFSASVVPSLSVAGASVI